MTDYSTKIRAADEFAAEAHAGQTEFHGNLYIDHPRRVADLVRPLGVPYQVSALLHDTIEDTPITLTDIAHMFGSDIAKTVDVLSRRPDDETYDGFITRVIKSKNPVAIAVKTADVLDHIRPESEDFFVARPTMKRQYLSAICRLRQNALTL